MANSGAFEPWDALTTALGQRGVPHVRPTRHVDTPPIGDSELFVRLWSSADPRLRDSAVVLLLVRPELADAAADAIGRLDGTERERAMMAYIAASALQRMWRTRLALTLGEQLTIPPRYLERWLLPSLEMAHGERTLLRLSALEESAYGYDAWAGYGRLMEQLLGELELAPTRA